MDVYGRYMGLNFKISQTSILRPAMGMIAYSRVRENSEVVIVYPQGGAP